MKHLLVALSILSLTTSALAKEPAKAPDTPLNETEQQFVGKWKGSRLNFKWEIERKEDRTFEIVFSDPDPEDPSVRYKNYAIGVWWIEGADYKFEWTKWWGDEGDFSGLQIETVKSVKKDKVVTLSNDDIDPKNIEIRVEEFKMSGWKLKKKAK